MCGRYELSGFLKDRMSKQIEKRVEEKGLTDYQTGEVFPGGKCLVFIPKKEGKIDVDVKNWVIPLQSLLINARIETLDRKPFYRSFINNRCVVIANGFYEWHDKRKFYIHKEDPYIFMPGIFTDKDEFVILTGASYGDMKKIHERTPLLFDKEEMLRYLRGTQELIVHNEDLIIESR